MKLPFVLENKWKSKIIVVFHHKTIRLTISQEVNKNTLRKQLVITKGRYYPESIRTFLEKFSMRNKI